jgi:uncharacterized protein (TIGR03089 family)
MLKSVEDLTKRLSGDPGRPRLTWYGDDGERIELSGAVLENWVSKTTNLLVEEFDAAPGVTVLLDLPVHWRTTVWALAAWRCGATVQVAASGDAVEAIGTTGPADVVVTARPERHAGARDVVAVALPALARAYPGTLPRGAVDAASAVMTYADVVLAAPAPDPAAPALEADGLTVTHGDLFAWAAGAAGSPAPGARVLVGGDAPLPDALRRLLAVWADEGSVVLTSAATAAALDDDAARRERLVAQEGVTDVAAQDRPGQDRPGQDRPGQDRPGQDRPGQD